MYCKFVLYENVDKEQKGIFAGEKARERVEEKDTESGLNTVNRLPLKTRGTSDKLYLNRNPY